MLGLPSRTSMVISVISVLHLLHDLHEYSPWPRQDQVADGPVVVGQHVQSVHRHHELTHLHTVEAQVC